MESQGWEGGQASKAGGERKARSPAWTAAPPGPPGLVQGAEQRGADGSDHVIQLTETLDLPGIFRGCTYLISPAAPRAVTCEIPISQVAKLRPTGSRGYRRAGMPSGSGSLQSPGGKASSKGVFQNLVVRVTCHLPSLCHMLLVSQTHPSPRGGACKDVGERDGPGPWGSSWTQSRVYSCCISHPGSPSPELESCLV